jgi:hypothetical protein
MRAVLCGCGKRLEADEDGSLCDSGDGHVSRQTDGVCDGLHERNLSGRGVWTRTLLNLQGVAKYFSQNLVVLGRESWLSRSSGPLYEDAPPVQRENAP